MDKLSDDELIRRATEFNDAAEAYWQALRADASGRRGALNKPFATVQEAPGLLYRLGLVLDALDLGVGFTVLDFGAGSCWLSASLNRLRCRTISMDVSAAALELGREAFALDPRLDPELKPRFLRYDGHRIDLADQAVDRVVMFDAFHHVPNQEEVLAEAFRVLRPGGRAVLAEPGEGHSHSDQSLFESESSGVLENDLDLADVERKALRAGFTQVLLKPYPGPSFSLPAGEYRRLIGGEERLFPLMAVRDDLRHFYIFVLEKGPAAFDSRNPRRLAARIEVPDGLRLAGDAGAQLALPASLTNTGDTSWRHELDPLGGYVTLGGHLADARGRHIKRGHLRAALPRDVAPGETVTVDARLDLPSPLGRYRLRLDLVDEYVTWFEQVGSPTLDLELEVLGYPDSRAPHQLTADVELPSEGALSCARPGARLELPVTLRNSGDSIWRHAVEHGPGQVGLGGHLLTHDGRSLEWEFFRVPLPADVAPGESCELRCVFAAPPDPGRYTLRLDLVADQVGWFESWGSRQAERTLEVGAGQPDSSAPGRLLAELELRPPARGLRLGPGESRELALAARNAGNTLWLAAERREGGHVALGAHLLDAAGRVLEPDFLRAPLPRDVAPGESVGIAAVVVAPVTPGRYILELDLVDEGIAWFGPRGSATLQLPVEVVE